MDFCIEMMREQIPQNAGSRLFQCITFSDHAQPDIEIIKFV